MSISSRYLSLSVNVENIGKREGCEVVQIYVRDVHASLVRPVKELKAFKRVTLQPKEKAEISFEIPVDMLNFTNTLNRRMVEAGEFEIMVGASSSDIRLTGEGRNCRRRPRARGKLADGKPGQRGNPDLS